MSPYQPPRDSHLFIPLSDIQAGESLMDAVERYERSIQDGLCPLCKTPLWPEDNGMALDCDDCGFAHELPRPMVILN
jgi:hypothetical protein